MMLQCSRCNGFVPEGGTRCPHCSLSAAHPRWKSWLSVPLALAGAGAAAVTLSACYGVPCVSKLPDGGTKSQGFGGCVADCNAPLADGGNPQNDPLWREDCLPPSDDGGSDAGADGGSDGGP